jgi:RNA polymerase sigma-70 factor, ECF subfamily
MGRLMTDNSREIDEWIRRAKLGDVQALAELFGQFRPRLERMVRLRLDPRLRGRLDPSDVLQEAYLEAAKKFTDFIEQESMPLFLWLRLVTTQKLTDIHRFHGMQKRDTKRELSVCRGSEPPASSVLLARQFLGRLSSPSRIAIRAELRRSVQDALDGLDPIDREVLALRHFEHLSNAETAQVLGIKPNAASNRYIRAVKRLRSFLSAIPGFTDELSL